VAGTGNDGGSPADRNNAVNYLLRTAQQSNVHLSAMADQKASIVLGAAFVMATVASGDLISAEDPAPALIVRSWTTSINRRVCCSARNTAGFG